MEVPASLTALSAIAGGWFSLFVSDNPLIMLTQGLLFSLAALLMFLVFFVTRDILHRSHALSIQVASILLVALFPFVGFFLYLLIRPRCTLEEREMQESLRKILAMLETEPGEHRDHGQSVMHAKRALFSCVLRRRKKDSCFSSACPLALL